MKKILLTMLAAMTVAGCSEYGRLLKSEDPNAHYQAAKKYIQEKKYDKAKVMLEKSVMPFMGAPQADSIMFYHGLVYYNMKEYDASGEFFDNFRTTYPRSPLLEEAEYLYAMGHYHLSPEAVRDQSSIVSNRRHKYLYQQVSRGSQPPRPRKTARRTRDKTPRQGIPERTDIFQG